MLDDSMKRRSKSTVTLHTHKDKIDETADSRKRHLPNGYDYLE